MLYSKVHVSKTYEINENTDKVMEQHHGQVGQLAAFSMFFYLPGTYELVFLAVHELKMLRHSVMLARQLFFSVPEGS